MKIGRRSALLLAQLPLAAALVLLGALALRTLATLGRSSQRILRENYASAVAAQRMNEAAERLEGLAAARVAGRTAPDERDRQTREFDRALQEQEHNITEPGEAEATATLRDRWRDYQSRSEAFYAAQGTDELRRRYFDELEPSFGQVRDAARRILDINQASMVEKSEEARRVADRSRWLVLASAACALAIGLSASIVLTRRALADLLRAQQILQATIDDLPDPVLVLGADGAVLGANGAARALPEEAAEVVARLRGQVVAGKGAYQPAGFDEALRVGERALLPRATPLRSGRGATLVLQDVTRLLLFDELKNDLVATVAHEVRTPLTSLRMAIEMLAGGVDTRQQQELLAAARDDCARLQAIVDDLLDLSRIQSGKVEVSPAPVSPHALVERVVAQREAEAAEADVRLRAEIGDPAGPVLADAERVRLVFDNLIGNALRHSPRGSTVVVRAAPAGGEVRFEVADHGPGVAPEYRERIFEKFFRVPGTKGDGIGLGLYISREIVRAHGGEMGLESRPGAGARFWFTLPVAAA